MALLRRFIFLIVATSFVVADDLHPIDPKRSKSNRVPISELEKHMANMEATGGYKKEFDLLGDPGSPLKSWNDSYIPENEAKHRKELIQYNLRTYDETRVLLKPIPDVPHSEYIVANWVDTPAVKKRYIATQCPIVSTFADFYRMVWEYNVHEIVMIAHPLDIDHGDCDQYYPDETTTYGDIEVKPIRRINEPDVVKRVYTLKRGDAVRVLVHHQLQKWPTTSAIPTDPKSMLNLVRKYRESDLYNRKEYPVIVHCAAGISRTGTFILSDSIYDMAMEEQVVDFIRQLQRLREGRISLIQQPDQYRFAHQVILEAHKQGLFTGGKPTAERTGKSVTIENPHLANEDIVLKFTSNK